MKKILLLIGILLLPITYYLLPVNAQHIEQPLNDGWKFTICGSEPKEVTLPHTWNDRDAQDNVRAKDVDKSVSTYLRDVGTYTREIDIPADYKNRKRVFVRFEAASQVATVYLNGRIIGDHKGAFTAFCLELTDYLNYGGKNELKVEVDNRWRADVPPISGGFAIFGGLYRPARLIVTDQLCVSPLYYGSDGVFVDAFNGNVNDDADVNADRTITVRTILNYAHWSYSKMDVRIPDTTALVRITIFDPQGKEVTHNDQTVSIHTGEDKWVTADFNITDPQLWHGKNGSPLYKVQVDLFSPSGEKYDGQRETFGIRKVEIDKEKGILLNGQPYPVYGVARHQDAKDKGWALTKDDDLRDMQIMDEMGVTAIRMAHYPQSEQIHNLADSMGFLVWDEVSLVNDVRNTPEFNANAGQFMMEMMMQLYNHPSVCWWGLFNEIDFPETPYPQSLFHELNDMAHKYGGNRLTASASNKGLRYYNGIADCPAWNNYPGWYWMLRWPKEEANKGRVGGFGEWMDYRSKEIAGRPFALSEYGAGGNPEHHMEGALPEQLMETMNAPFHPEEWQCYVHEEDWRTIKQHSSLLSTFNSPHSTNLWGSFVWAMFDFIVPGWGEGGMQNINTKGLVTHDRKLKKDVFYFYQANWSKKPMVYITSRRMTERKLAQQNIKVYSNASRVTLYLNGKMVSTLMPDDIHVCLFRNITLRPGTNTIEVRTNTHQRDSITITLDK